MITSTFKKIIVSLAILYFFIILKAALLFFAAKASLAHNFLHALF